MTTILTALLVPPYLACAAGFWTVVTAETVVRKVLA